VGNVKCVCKVSLRCESFGIFRELITTTTTTTTTRVAFWDRPLGSKNGVYVYGILCDNFVATKWYCWCQCVGDQNLKALRQVSRALHGQSSTSNSTAPKLYTGKDVDPCDLQLKVKDGTSSTLIGSKGHHGHVMTFGRQNAVASRDDFFEFPQIVSALDVYKVRQ